MPDDAFGVGGEIDAQTARSLAPDVELERNVAQRLGREGVDLAYTHSAQDAQDRLWAGEYQLAFLLSPMDVSVIKQVADGGERLPGKSTYFYPKLPTGLAIHRLVGEQ